MIAPSRWARRALAAALVVTATAGPAVAGDSAPCLGPGVGKVLASLAGRHAFDGMAPSAYRLKRLDVKSDHIELGYDDAAGPAVTVVLDVESPVGADARGPHFSHHVVETHGHASAEDRAAMLRAAMLLDAAVPASEMRRCGGPAVGGGKDGERSMPARAPAVFGVGVGAVEAAILLAALVLGLRGPRRGRREPASRPS